jgi:YD repeat-containing protein
MSLGMNTSESRTKICIYDNTGRLTDIDYPTGPETEFGYDDINRLTSLTDGTGTKGYDYDAANRLEEIASLNGIVSSTYDDISRRYTKICRFAHPGLWHRFFFVCLEREGYGDLCASLRAIAIRDLPA